MKPITIYVPEKHLKYIEELVMRGYAPSRSEFTRAAIMRYLRKIIRQKKLMEKYLG